jgi:hypothetical protein
MSIAQSAEQSPSPFPASLIRHPGLQMALATFAILVLELALIRWVGSQIRIAAYFTNLVLIAAFLGMGLGVALGRRRPELFRLVFPGLALLVGVLSLAEPLHFVTMRFPDPAIALWGEESDASSMSQTLVALTALLSCFWAITLVFIGAGIPVGVLFARMPALSAYRWDLAGSLLGVIVMSVMAWLGATPPIWFGVGLLALLTLDRRSLNWICAAIIIAASAWSAGQAVFSPYNRIDVQKAEFALDHPPGRAPAEWEVSVNRDYHQFMLDLRSWPEQVINIGEMNRSRLAAIYEIPFKLTDSKDSALVVGAGTGNDAAAALRSGFQRVVSVDIDPRIIELGSRMHPERPYSDSRVVPVVNDARAYFQQNRDEKFDVVCYGLLDSHSMFSAMSSLRLDNYVYTREGIAAGWSHVKDDGVMTVSFSVYAGKWMVDRFFLMVREATGLKPYIVMHGYDFGATFVVGRHLTLDRVRRAFPEVVVDYAADAGVRIPTDDWPFLYIRPNTSPITYLAVLSLIGITALLALRRVFGARAFRSGGFDTQAFLLGAAFMLLETRMVTALSLLFGSTWIVNSSVFGGILLMVLLANAVAEKFKPRRLELWYGPLVLCMLAIWLSSTSAFNTLPILQRAIVAGLLYSLPMFFAGVIFSGLLQRRNDTGATLGSNLCGAVVGGLLEYLSTIVGMKAIVLLALSIYLGSALVHERGKSLDQIKPT